MADALRIRHVIRAKPPGELGGADVHVVDQATAQAAQGHDVGVVCLGPAEIAGHLLDRGVPHLQVDTMSMARWAGALVSSLRTGAPDVMHAHGYRADIVTSCVAR